MKPMDYIKIRGLIVCLEECGYNIRALKAMIKRECPEITTGQWNYFQKKCKHFLSENVISKKEELIKEIKLIFEEQLE